MDPVLVKTMIGVLRVLAIVVAWKANISPIWLCERMSRKLSDFKRETAEVPIENFW